LFAFEIAITLLQNHAIVSEAKHHLVLLLPGVLYSIVLSQGQLVLWSEALSLL
jgi:hypothetical protein